MQKLGLKSSLLAAIFSFPLTSYALGLGEIEASSYLNQPLKAEIEVISARPGEIDDLLISLASRDAFEKAGLERPAGLSKLRFKVEKSEDGQTAKILVSTKTAVQEPFLSFLVEADWAKGRLLREFTILLDPLSFAQEAVKPAPQVAPEQAAFDEPESEESQSDFASSSTAEAKVVDESPQQAIAQPIAMPIEPSAEQNARYDSANSVVQDAASEDQVVVSKGDTLWGIAAQFKDQNHTMAQVMLAMQMMNPDAFYKDNINNLKVGAVLRVPDMDVMDRLSKQEAYAQVLDQNGLWDEYVARKSGSTSTAVADSSTGIKSNQQKADSQLSLLTPDEGDSDSASLQNNANSNNAGQIRKKLALAEEELEAARLENEDLKSRIELLEQQQEKFEELQKLVQIKDGNLAQLQQTVAEAETEVVEVTEDIISEEIVPDDLTATSDAQVTEEKPSEIMIEAAGELLAEEEVAEQAEAMDSADNILQQDASTEAETVLPTTEETVDIAEQDQIGPSEVETVPVPVIVTQEPESATEDGLMDMLPSMQKLLSDPVMLGGIGAILALLLGFVLLKRKKSDGSDEGITLEEPDNLIDDDATPIHIPSTTQFSDEDEDQVKTSIMDSEENLVETVVSEVDVEDEEDEFSKTAVISEDEMQQTTQVTEAVHLEQDDVLNEVDVYLAYGLYDNAEDLLTESLQNNPDRADYRAKLLDTHFATKNTDAFIKEAEILKSMGSAANRFWDRTQIMGFELAPENELFSGAKDSGVSVEDLEYAKPDSADFDISSDEDVNDFSNTDFDLSDDSFKTAEIDISDISDISISEFADTQDLDSLEDSLDLDFPDLEDESESKDLPEDIDSDELKLEDESDQDLNLNEELEVDEGELDISEEFEIDNELDDELESDQDALSFELPDALDLSSEEDSDSEIIELEPTVEAPPSLNEVPPMDEDGLELNIDGSDFDELDVDETPEVEEADLSSETLVVSPDEQEEKATIVEDAEQEELNAEIPFDDDLDFDMSDMEDASLQSGQFTPSDTLALSPVEQEEDDITEFKPADITGEFDAFIAEATDEVALAEVDAAAGLDKTGTFAPGDFNEDDVEDMITSVDDIEDIEDLMLPDDVDEVGTKLDLAKAFIDMGDAEGARSSLEEVLSEGTDEQKAEATALLDEIK